MHEARSATKNQERFLLSEAVTGVRPLLPVSYRIIGVLDADRLVKAVETVIARHDALRAKAYLAKGQNISVDVQTHGHSVTFEDISQAKHADTETLLVNRLVAAMERHDGQFRSLLLKVSPQEHVLTVIPHHALVDGASIVAILKEISLAYDGAERPAVEPDTSPLEQSASQQDTAFWRDFLSDLAPPQPITAGNNTSDDFGTECWRKAIPNDLHQKLRQFGKQTGVRTVSIYLGLFMTALSRLTGQDDVAVAFQSAGRKALGVSETTVGMFSKALILRQRDAGAAPDLQHLDRNLGAALKHEALNYQDIISTCGQSPLFAFNWYPPHDGLQIVGCRCAEDIIVPWPSTFDINLHIVTQADAVELRLFWNPAKLSEELVEHLGGMLLSFLDQIVTDTSMDLASPGLGPLGSETNSLPRLETINEQFLARSREHPQKAAIQHHDGTLTYEDVKQHVDRLAQRFAGKRLVAIIAHRGPGVAIGCLAARSAGAAFVLIDPCYPHQRILRMLDIIDPDLMVFGDPFLGERDALAAENFEHLNCPGLSGCQTCKPRAQPKLPKDAAYVLFTSGSTGTPKCIVSREQPLAYSLDWQAREFGIDSQAIVANLAGIGHDPVLRDILLPLTRGATLVCPDPNRIFEAGYLSAWIEENSISVAHVTPSMLRLIETGHDENHALGTLRHIFLGGESVDWQIINRTRALAPQAQIANVYGASETPQIVIYNRVPSAASGTGIVPIGVPRPDVIAHVLTKEGRVCGTFEPGEICIQTPLLSAGYIDAEQTNKAFHLPSDECAAGTYRTGDIGYILADRTLVLLGRKDDQVKINGYRVELREVEVALTEVAKTNNCAVVAHVGPKDQQARLIGFVAGAVSDADIQGFLQVLRQRLTRQMVPERIIHLDELPLLPSGKVDRKALSIRPLPSPSQPKGDGQPTSARERELLAIWQKVLGTDDITIDDSMFNLGGDSLTSVRLMLEMEREGLDPNLARSILRGSTIRDLARGLDSPHQSQHSKTLTGEILSRTSIHVLRGLLVGLIIMGHWFPGLIERFPAFVNVGTALTPAFNLATPGFAIIFGVSLGYFMFDTYRNRPQILRRQLRIGVIVLFLALITIAILDAAHDISVGETIDYNYVAVSLYNVLGYYLLALMSVGLWFAFLNRGRHSVMLALLIGIYICLDLTARALFVPYEPEGLVQLARLYATAKFSYFNMSFGVLIGLGAGLWIARTHDAPVKRSFVFCAAAALILGLTGGAFYGELAELLSASRRIDYWKWATYIGLLGLLASLTWRCAARWAEARTVFGSLLRIIAAAGVLALPFFVFHDIILSAKLLLDAVGLPDIIGVLIVLSTFFGIGAIAISRVRKFYYP